MSVVPYSQLMGKLGSAALCLILAGFSWEIWMKLNLELCIRFSKTSRKIQNPYIYVGVCVRVLAGDHKANSMNTEDGQQ